MRKTKSASQGILFQTPSEIEEQFRKDRIKRYRHYYRRTAEGKLAIAKSNGKRYQKLRAIKEKLKSNPCMDCGGSFPACAMDFDHTRGKKKFAIGEASGGRSLENIIAEISKCDLICSNCHRIRTAKRRKAAP